MKKTYIIIIAVAIIFGLGGLYYYLNKDDNKTASETVNSDVSYEEDDDDVDFSSMTTTNINLSELDDNLTITDEGIYNISGTFTNHYIIVNTDKNIKIILNNVTITNSSGPCIYIKSAKNAYIELSGTNTLEDGTSYSGFDEDVNGCIYSADDLVIEGDGTLNITANYADGIVGKDDLTIKNGNINITSEDDGMRGKDSLVILDGIIDITSGGDGLKSTNDTDTTKGYILIESGTINITSTLDAIQAETKVVITGGTFNIKTGGGSSITTTSSVWGNWSNTSSTTESAKGIKAGSVVSIKDATITIDSSDDGIHSNDSLEILSGTISIDSGDDGIHADSTIVIDDGTININQSYEGIEANNITINSGTINIESSDDGINVNGGNDQSAQGGRPGKNTYSSSDSSNLCLTITGGTIYVNAGGDGLDSNGSIVMTGGNVSVDGPTDNSNGPIDYNDTFKISGGVLIAAGSSGMAQNTSSGSTQNSVIIYFSTTQAADTKVSIGDIEYTPSKTFSSIVVSSSSLETNTKYTVKLNGTTYTTFTISSTNTSVGNASSTGGR